MTANGSLLGCFVAATFVAASGCSASVRGGSGGAGGDGAATGGAAGAGGAGGLSSTGGTAEGGGAGGVAGVGGAPFIAGGGGGGSAGGGAASATSSGGAGIGGLGGAAGAVAGQGGSQSEPCGEQVVCVLGQKRCQNQGMQTCQADLNGCPFWGPTPGQPMSPLSPDCPPNHVVCFSPGVFICDCPSLTSPLCGPGGKGPLREGDYCVTPGTTTFATCHLVDGCYVETKDLACPPGTTCKQAASLQLVPAGAACE